MRDEAPIRLRMLLALLAAVLSIGLAFSLLSLPVGVNELAGRVFAQIPKSGADHPVTAVLLNFRSYDTMLELGVLFLAVVGVWSLGPAKADPAMSMPIGPVLRSASQVLYPMMLLVAGYLLWVGTSAPGGAFQAGAIVAAGGVLAMLSGWQPGARLRFWVEGGLAIGLAVFVCVAAITLTLSGVMLALTPKSAKSTILIIELAATVSIGIALAAVFQGGSPARWNQSEQK